MNYSENEDNIVERLKKIHERFSEDDFLSNKGISNEVGIHVFCYDPKDEFTVRRYVQELKEKKCASYRIVECDLYKIFIEICNDKHILQSIPNMEEQRGKGFLLEQLQKVAPPEMYIEKMKYEPHNHGDILLITGLGKVFPFMRSHNILDNIQSDFSDIPVVMLYPGTFNGQDLGLFGEFLDAHYYRAFNLL